MSLPLKWEFPGGKLELNESPQDCILREIKEEINIEIELIEKLDSKIYHYDDFSITLIPFIANYRSGNIYLSEHKDYKWLLKKDLFSLDWALADIAVVEDFLKQDYGHPRSL